MGSDKSDDEEDRERILAPDDLDITRQPEVEEIDEGRYVVSPNGPAKKPNKDLLENPDWLNEPEEDEPSHPSRKQPSRKDGHSDQSTKPKQSPADDQSTSSTQSTPDTQSTSSAPQSTDRRGQSKKSTGEKSQSQPETQTTSSQSPSGTQSTASSHPTREQPADRQSTSGAPDSASNGNPSSANKNQSQPAKSQSTASSQTPTNTDLAAHDQPPVDPPAVEFTNENVSKFLAASLAESSGDYGFDATINIEGQVKRGQMTSDDIGETLETLLRWYAKQTTDEIDPEAVLGIILAGSDLAVEYPVQSAYSMLKRHGLKPDDSIGDLLAAVREEGSFTIPPSKDR